MIFFLVGGDRVQEFPGVLIVVGHFLDSFLLEVNFICWNLDSMVSFLVWLLENSYLPNKGAMESQSPLH